MTAELISSAGTGRARSRFWRLVAAGTVVGFGLASRRWPGLLPAQLGRYPGDALWALMVYFLWGALLPRASTGRVAVLALITAYLVELSQLYQAPWFADLRQTRLGHLVLGSGFDWYDLVAYPVGVLIGVLFDRLGSAGPRGEIPARP